MLKIYCGKNRINRTESLILDWVVWKLLEVWKIRRVQEAYKVCGGLEAPKSPKGQRGPEGLAGS